MALWMRQKISNLDLRQALTKKVYIYISMLLTDPEGIQLNIEQYSTEGTNWIFRKGVNYAKYLLHPYRKVKKKSKSILPIILNDYHYISTCKQNKVITAIENL